MTLEDLKAGDTAVVSYGYGPHNVRLVKIDHVTKYHLIVGATKYQKKSGRAVGSDTWCSNHIMVPTEDLVKAAKLQSVIEKIDAIRWRTLPMDTLLAVLKIVGNDGGSQ